MNMSDQELPPELKLKLLEIENRAEKESASGFGVVRAVLLGAVGFAVIPWFGVFLFPVWKVIIAMVIFSAAGGFLFGIASWCRSSRK